MRQVTMVKGGEDEDWGGREVGAGRDGGEVDCVFGAGVVADEFEGGSGEGDGGGGVSELCEEIVSAFLSNWKNSFPSSLIALWNDSVMMVMRIR